MIFISKREISTRVLINEGMTSKTKKKHLGKKSCFADPSSSAPLSTVHLFRQLFATDRKRKGKKSYVTSRWEILAPV